MVHCEATNKQRKTGAEKGGSRHHRSLGAVVAFSVQSASKKLPHDDSFPDSLPNRKSGGIYHRVQPKTADDSSLTWPMFADLEDTLFFTSVIPQKKKKVKTWLSTFFFVFGIYTSQMISAMLFADENKSADEEKEDWT